MELVTVKYLIDNSCLWKKDTNQRNYIITNAGGILKKLGGNFEVNTPLRKRKVREMLPRCHNSHIVTIQYMKIIHIDYTIENINSVRRR